MSTDLTPAPSEKVYIEIKKAIKIEMPIVLKSTFVLMLLNDINNKATQIIKIPTKPKKGIISFRKTFSRNKTRNSRCVK